MKVQEKLNKLIEANVIHYDSVREKYKELLEEVNKVTMKSLLLNQSEDLTNEKRMAHREIRHIIKTIDENRAEVLKMELGELRNLMDQDFFG